MIGILSDAHGNRPAFDRSIKTLREYGVTKFIYLGDSVGYLPTLGVVEAIQELGSTIRCIRGNHEDTLINESFDSTLEPVYQHQSVKRQMNLEVLNFIKSWPTHLVIDFNSGRSLFIHGSPQDFTCGYVYPDTDLTFFNVAETYVFMGHTHLPFIRHAGRTTYVNAGSCGLPRDNGALGSVALFNEITGNIQILRFGIEEETQEALVKIERIHPSVHEVFLRRTGNYEGTIVEN